MRVLGINSSFHLLRDESAFGHDASAVLLDQGSIVAAAEEERFTRVKHTGSFPVNAIRYCLNAGNIGLNALDCIAIHGAEHTADFEVYMHFLREPRLAWPGAGADHVGGLFQTHFGVDVRSRLRWCDHHLAHAWSAFACSGLRESLVVTLDGAGDSRSGAVFVGSGRSLEPVTEYSVPESLGMMYWFVTMVLGYTHHDEYKVMGLAPWGNRERFGPLFRSLYDLLDDGRFQFQPVATIRELLHEAGVLQQARARDAAFTATRADIAAALQQTVEDLALHLVGHYRRTTGQTNLCLAGGVAHNCSMVGRILKTGWFRRVFVQPAAHDGGGGLGAALWASCEHDQTPHGEPLNHVYLGPDVGTNEQVHARLADWEPLVSFSVADDVASVAARLLADGHVLGWVQGRSEFGPRALGNRSILADPRPAGNKDRINAMIKKREAFRPFAPAVRQEAFGDYFDGHGLDQFPFMTVVVDVLESRRGLLGAVTHVDGTARVQTVTRDANPLFYDLLCAFERLTGVPILLNTSFNNFAEPIVQSVDDAVACFITSGLDCVVIGNCLVVKPEMHRIPVLLNELVPSIPFEWQLFRRCPVGADGTRGDEAGLATNPMHRDHRREYIVSAGLAEILLRCDGCRSLAEIAHEPLSDQLLAELFDLWTKRAVAFSARRRRGASEATVSVGAVEEEASFDHVGASAEAGPR